MLEPFQNFAKASVSTGYNDTATSVVLSSGGGALLCPNGASSGVPVRGVWWDFTDYPNPSDDPNREIVLITGVSTDTLTVTRAIEGPVASTKNTAGKTYKIMTAVTSAQLGSFPRVVWAGYSGASTASTSEVSLMSKTLPAIFPVGGRFRISHMMKKTGTVNVASGYLKFGTTKVWDGGSTMASTDTMAWIETDVWIEGSSAQRARSFGRDNGGSSVAAGMSTPAEAISGSIVLDFRGNVANASDTIALAGYTVEYIAPQ